MTDTAELFIDCHNALGEGPLWHPGRQELFWFDIAETKLFRANARGELLGVVDFAQPVSAAAVVDQTHLLIASATAILDYDIETGRFAPRLPLEADDPVTRSNDCRVTPQGAWWISTMGRQLEKGAGKVYHYFRGELDLIRSEVTIPNATCFTENGRFAFFVDGPTRKIQKVALDPETGFPVGDWELFVDLKGQVASPDGAVCDTEGFVWNAEYGSGRVVRYAPDGSVDRIVTVPSPNVTCPCFGGPELKTLYLTTAVDGMSEADLAQYPHAGGIFAIETDVAGQAETPIAL